MSLRRNLTSLAAAVAATVLLLAVPAQAQFTPRFSQKGAGQPVQWHLGIGVTAINLSDYTSERWPELDTPLPIVHLRGAVALPLGAKASFFLVPEFEVNIASTKGVYNDPYPDPIELVQLHTVSQIGQRGFSVMLNLVRSLDDRKTLLGAGLGYHWIQDDPARPSSMMVREVQFIADPFEHLGIGLQFHAARAVAQLSAKTRLMVEGRYKYVKMSGNTSGRDLLLSEFQLTAYLAIK
jgi:hypothetical protein